MSAFLAGTQRWHLRREVLPDASCRSWRMAFAYTMANPRRLDDAGGYLDPDMSDGLRAVIGYML